MAARQRVTQPQRAGLDSSQYNKKSVSKRKICKSGTLGTANDTRTILTSSTKYRVLAHVPSLWTLFVAPVLRGSAALETTTAVVITVCRVTNAGQKYSRPAHRGTPNKSQYASDTICVLQSMFDDECEQPSSSNDLRPRHPFPVRRVHTLPATYPAVELPSIHATAPPLVFTSSMHVLDGVL